MRITLGKSVRGSGKHFVEVDVSDIVPNDAIVVTAYTQDRLIDSVILISCKLNIQSSSKRKYVVVLPQLSTSMVVIFEELDANGAVVDTVRKPISPQVYKWRSRINYRLEEKASKWLRNYDEYHGVALCQFVIAEVVSCGDRINIRGSLKIPDCILNNSISIKCFDSEYQSIDQECIICKDFLKQHELFDAYDRVIQFSIFADHTQDSKYILQTYADEVCLEGFYVIDHASLKDYIFAGSRYFLNASNDPEYQDWFNTIKATESNLQDQSRVCFEILPKFSIVVPLFHTPVSLFDEMLCSVTDQSYSNWELVLINASTEDEDLTHRVLQAVSNDNRIKSIDLDENLGISENTSKGIKAATGDFVAYFDHDDLLEPDILFEYTKAINEDPSIDVLYCDEDKIDEHGNLFCPNFKPDFAIDRLRNNNYVCHMLTIRRTLLDKLEGSNKTHDGAQDYNLILQASEKTNHIKHIPKILYHWRALPNSTALNADSKPYTTDAGRLSLEQHLERLGIEASVKNGKHPNTYFIEYEIEKPHPKISIIIPSKDESAMLKRCIDSIEEKSTYRNYEILIIENNSEDPKTFEFYDRISQNYSNVRVVKWEYEFNFSKLINFGVANTSGQYLLLLNNDTEVIARNWMEIMLGYCQREDVGVVGAKLLYPDKSIQHAGVAVVPACAEHINLRMPNCYGGYFDTINTPQDLSAVTGACMMTKRSVFEEVNGFDEELKVAFNDIDYCLKVRDAGYLVVYDPRVELYHYESISRGNDDEDKNKTQRLIEEAGLMNMRWAHYYAFGDPYLNPNVTFNVAENESYMLRW